MTGGSAGATRIAAASVVTGVALLAAVTAFSAATRSSATFDEIVLTAGGVRGLATDRWEMVTDQPPLMMYLYGAAARGAVDALPAEDRDWLFDDRWAYAQALFFGSANDTDAVLRRARTVGVTLAAATVASAGALAWWIAGPWTGALAAALAALLPDVLAHGGVAYNDVPLALAFLLAVWALDVFMRRPGPARGALAGGAVALALGTKMSALALLPVAALLFAAEGSARHREGAWRRDVSVGGVIAVLAAYVALVVLYRGDPTLTLLRFNFWRTVLHSTGGHEAPAYLLGDTSPEGWWYYFPVAFLFKTPVAFQAAGAIALVAAVRTVRSAGDRWLRVAAWRGRGALLGALVFGAFLLRSELNAGFRYALPVLPLLAVLTAVGLARPWVRIRRAKGAVVGALLALQAASVATAYPHLIAYSSLWAGGRDRAYLALADSNVDWGQGLIELRDFMEGEGVRSVRLSYFGSALPEAYGIEYVALPSFFRLARSRTQNADASPRFTVLSANNLLGLYLQGRDPFAAYRDREPYAVLGHSLFVFDDGGPP